MKKPFFLSFFISAISFIVFAEDLYSQSDLTSTKNDPRNYFYIDNQTYDISTLEPVQTSIPSGILVTYNNKDVNGVVGNGKVYFFDLDWNKLGEINLENKQISPDLGYVLYVEEGDIWIQEVLNFKELGKERRLTSFGQFRGLYVSNWYGEKVIISTTSSTDKLYLLNTKTAEISAYEGPKPYSYTGGEKLHKPQISPNRRFMMGGVVDPKSYFAIYTKIQIYDLEKDIKLELPLNEGWAVYTQYPIWISNNEFIVITYLKENREKFSFLGLQIGENGDFKVKTNYVDIIPDIGSMSFNFDYGDLQITSRGNKFILLYETYLVDVGNGKVTSLLKPNSEERYEISRDFNHNRRTGYSWMNENKIIVGIFSGDILTSGTYIVDANTMKREKVTSFVATEFFVFPESGYILFLANDKLYRLKEDGSDLTEMTSMPNLGRYPRIGKWLQKASGGPSIMLR